MSDSVPTNTDAQSFAARRKRLGLSAREAATQARIARGTLVRIESGDPTVRDSSRERYDQFLRTGLETLAAEADNRDLINNLESQVTSGRAYGGRPLETIFRGFAVLLDTLSAAEQERVTRRLARTYSEIKEGYPDPLERYATATRLVCNWFDDENTDAAAEE